METENGSATSFLRVDGERERIDAPAGPTRWMRLTIVGSTVPRPGVTGAGFSEVELPGVRVTRLLRLPEDGEDTTASARIVSLHRAADPTGLSLAGSESGLRRIVDAVQAGTYAVRASAVAVPGEALDRLLYEVAPQQRRRIVATADSTARLGAGLSARNLTDGDLTTAWIAGDEPTVRLSWPGKRRIGELVLAPAGGLSARAAEVRITSPAGAVVAGVDDNGWVRFPPMTTDRLDIAVTRTAPLTVHNPAVGEDLQLPVGLTEAYVPALDDLRTPSRRATPRSRWSAARAPC
ncbi:hypothetical protein LUX09_22855 [Streptomyces albogriseolus]|nr:hypothetical protein [Streptomyces albogriseolus]